MNSNYVNHNRRILNAVAGEQHQQWLKEKDARALKRAKKDVMPMAGVRFKDFSELRVLVI
jgi:predicted ABC-class ATPase